MSTWREIGDIMRQDGIHDCRVRNAAGQRDPGCTNRHEEGHHGIFPAEKSKTAVEWRRFLDHPINYSPSCHACNTNRIADPEAARDLRFADQRVKYGAWQMRKWLRIAPPEIKGRHTWRRYWAACQEQPIATEETK